VDTARLNVSYTRIASPISGRVSKATVTIGNLIIGGANSVALTSVVSVDPIYIAFDGDEQTYLRNAELARRDGTAAPHNPVQVGLANEAGFPHEGKLVFLDNQLDPSTGTIHARALLENADRRFTPGLFARVRLMGGSRHQALLIDDRAVGTDQSQKFVYVVGADNAVSYRAVQLGKSIDGLRVVSSGLERGEWIVVNGVQRVYPGVTVAPQRVAMARQESATRLASIAY
jgi:multidrug efflux system membrane fusion protein